MSKYALVNQKKNQMASQEYPPGLLKQAQQEKDQVDTEYQDTQRNLLTKNDRYRKAQQAKMKEVDLPD